MAQVKIKILKDVLDYSLRKFEHHIIGSRIYFIFNNERFAYVELKLSENHKSEYDGITISYISKLYGFIDKCDICFRDVFVDVKNASINVNRNTNTYDWFETCKPTGLDLSILAENVERFIDFVCDFGNFPSDYMRSPMYAIHAAQPGISGQVEGYKPYEISSPVEMLDVIEEDDKNSSQESIVNSDSEDTIAETIMPEKEKNIDTENLQTEESFDVSKDSEINPSDETVTDNLVPDDILDSVSANNDLSNSEVVSKEEQSLLQTDSDYIPENKDTQGTKKKFFGLFKAKETKDSKSSDNTALKTNIKEEQVQTEESYIKPFVCWNIGAKKETDIQAALYNTDTGSYSLVITGKGDMKDFRKSTPWYKYTDQITAIEIADGITCIGNNSFKSFSCLKSIVFPDSIVKIGLSAFEFCFKLEKIHWSKNLKVISEFAFSGTENLKEVTLPDSIVEIRDYAFDTAGKLVIYCNDPRKLNLGAGMSIKDFTKIKKNTIKIDTQNYML